MSAKPEPPKFNKAKLIIHNKDKKDEEIFVTFNPDKYSIRKSNKFASHGIAGKANPKVQFGSGESEMLSIELLFDTYTFENGEDVRTKYTDKIAKLLDNEDKQKEPPVCTFVWGEHPFTGILESLDRNFTMFNEQGTPVRETISLSLKKYEESESEKSSTENNTKSQEVKEGDSLSSIAEKEYGDPSKWKIIASANNIDDPLNLKLGIQIIIPPLNQS